MGALGFESGEALADGPGFTQDFVLHQVALGLEFGTHLGPEGVDLAPDFSLLDAVCGEFETEVAELCAKGFQLGAGGFLREFNLLLDAIHFDQQSLQIGRDEVLQHLANLGDEVLRHAE